MLANNLLFIQNIGPGGLVLILIVFIVFFGAKKIPELAKGIGKGINEFKKAKDEITNEIDSSDKDKDKKEA